MHLPITALSPCFVIVKVRSYLLVCILLSSRNCVCFLTGPSLDGICSLSGRVPGVLALDGGLGLLGSEEGLSPARTETEGELEVGQVW